MHKVKDEADYIASDVMKGTLITVTIVVITAKIIQWSVMFFL